MRVWLTLEAPALSVERRLRPLPITCTIGPSENRVP